MSIEASCRTLLSTAGAITAIVSTRVYNQQRLQGTALPALTFEVRQNDPVRVMSGPSGLYDAEVVVSSIAESYAAARTLADAVRGYFNGAFTTSTLSIQAVRLDGEAPLDSGLDDGEETAPTTIEQTYRIHYRHL